MKINLNFGMPELLVVYSAYMFSQHMTTALTALGLGIIGRVFQTMVEHGTDKKQNVLDTEVTQPTLLH